MTAHWNFVAGQLTDKLAKYIQSDSGNSARCSTLIDGGPMAYADRNWYIIGFNTTDLAKAGYKDK